MKYLITGCTGFVGARLEKALLEKGHEVFCISRAEVCPGEPQAHHLSHDFSISLNYDRLPKTVDGIIHTAATMEKDGKDYEMFRINTVSTLDLLEYGRRSRAKKFIYLSSGAVYGHGKAAFEEKSPMHPNGFYGLSKYQSELLVNHYSPQFPTTFILRLFFPYGPGQVRGIIPRLISWVKNRHPITICNEGAPRINPIHIIETVRAIEKCLSLENHGTINLAGDEMMSIKEISLFVGRQLGINPVLVEKKEENISDCLGANILMKQVLGVVPTISLTEGIKTML